MSSQDFDKEQGIRKKGSLIKHWQPSQPQYQQPQSQQPQQSQPQTLFQWPRQPQQFQQSQPQQFQWPQPPQSQCLNNLNNPQQPSMVATTSTISTLMVANTSIAIRVSIVTATSNHRSIDLSSPQIGQEEIDEMVKKERIENITSKASDHLAIK
ncbi:unnamed protein product [Rhizophagus irregularis]|nr:unnamed protein product [Rhizophagus irregularis]